jgi:Uma2 family endonuclease
MRNAVFSDASWCLYRVIAGQYKDLPLRITYAQRRLELTLRPLYRETVSRFLHAIVVAISIEREIRISSCGSMTLANAVREMALEPDECFYVANERAIRGKKRIDLAVDPPPDLVIEVDITHHVVDRERIYAEFGVPEMWRFDGK